jgi:hypothetical protein
MIDFGVIPFWFFGLWFAFFPRNVIRFYTLLLGEGSRAAQLKTPQVRISGALWLVFMAVFTLFWKPS